MIWPTDLLLSPDISYIRSWPRFCQGDHSKRFMNSGSILWPLECSQVCFCFLFVFFFVGFFVMFFFYNLTYWPTFWPDVTHIWTWLDLVKLIILSKFHEFWPNLWPLVCSQALFITWPTNLLFDPTQPIFKLDLNFVRIINLSKYHN